MKYRNWEYYQVWLSKWDLMGISNCPKALKWTIYMGCEETLDTPSF